jgi:hypothetical protein
MLLHGAYDDVHMLLYRMHSAFLGVLGCVMVRKFWVARLSTIGSLFKMEVKKGTSWK